MFKSGAIKYSLPYENYKLITSYEIWKTSVWYCLSNSVFELILQNNNDVFFEFEMFLIMCLKAV